MIDLARAAEGIRAAARRRAGRLAAARDRRHATEATDPDAETAAPALDAWARAEVAALARRAVAVERLTRDLP